MKTRRCHATLLACGSILCLAGTLWAQDVVSEGHSQTESTRAKAQSERAGAPEIIPHRKRAHPGEAPTAGSIGTITPVIKNHGGPVMVMPSVYLIWYGNWNQTNNTDTAEGQQIIRDFLHGLNDSPYYRTNTTYYDNSNHYVSGKFSVVGEYTDSYSQKTVLTDSTVQAVVTHAISSGNLLKDTNGIYFVLTSSDVSESSGFCSQYCGWHTSGTISGSNIKYSFVGNAAKQCLSSCAAQSVGPNGNAGVDGMVSVLAHELEETNTDPNGNAWYDRKGAEDADKCAWTFGSYLPQTSNGAYYNMTLPGLSGNSRPFLVQRELDVNSMCFVNYDTKAQ